MGGYVFMGVIWGGSSSVWMMGWTCYGVYGSTLEGVWRGRVYWYLALVN